MAGTRKPGVSAEAKGLAIAAFAAIWPVYAWFATPPSRTPFSVFLHDDGMPRADVVMVGPSATLTPDARGIISCPGTWHQKTVSIRLSPSMVEVKEVILIHPGDDAGTLKISIPRNK